MMPLGFNHRYPHKAFSITQAGQDAGCVSIGILWLGTKAWGVFPPRKPHFSSVFFFFFPLQYIYFFAEKRGCQILLTRFAQICVFQSRLSQKEAPKCSWWDAVVVLYPSGFLGSGLFLSGFLGSGTPQDGKDPGITFSKTPPCSGSQNLADCPKLFFPPSTQQLLSGKKKWN